MTISLGRLTGVGIKSGGGVAGAQSTEKIRLPLYVQDSVKTQSTFTKQKHRSHNALPGHYVATE